MKRFVSIIVGVVISVTIAIPVFATEEIENIPINNENLIEENNYYDEDLQGEVLEQTYFISDNPNEGNELFSKKNESGWFIKTKKCMEWMSGDVTKIYAKGYFTWKNGELSVSKESGGYNYIDGGAFDKDESISADVSGLPFYKYAYVLYNLKFKTNVGFSKDFSVKLTVNANGKTNGEKIK